MLGFFGAAGLGKDRVEAALNRLQAEIPGLPFGVNLIHSPNESSLEDAVARMFIQRGLRLIEASAYLRLTLPVVRFRVAGIHRDATGQIFTPNRIVAKVSRVEVATQFFSPPPAEMLNELVRTGELTAEQAALAAQIPVAQDVTAEADSAGHTDNRPLVTLLPTLLALRDRLQAQFNYAQPLRVGAAGGLSTPSGLAAALAMGAAYVVTGSVNQACVESGSSEVVRKMLAQAEQADTAMAPAADMFEMGVKLQVLKRGTMFPMRAAKLWSCSARIRVSTPFPRPTARSWRSSFSAPHWPRPGPARGPSGLRATPRKSSAPNVTRSTRWRSSSAVISASARAGQTPVSPRA